MAAPQQSVPTSPMMSLPVFQVDANGNPISSTNAQTVTANAGTNLNTSLLALETGGNLATIVTNTTSIATAANQTTGNTSLSTIATNTGHIPSVGQTTMSASTPVVVASDQSNLPANIKAVNGTTVATGNAALPVLVSTAQGQQSLYGSNPSTTGTNTDISIKWGVGGTTQVNHVLISNNTSSNVVYELDASTNAGSDILAPGQKVLFDVQTLIVHLQCASSVNVNGSSAGNVVVRGWL